MIRCLLLLAVMTPLTALAQFRHEAPGTLMAARGATPRVGAGRVDSRVYAPDILFPIRGLAYANSQVYAPGGSQGVRGSQCSSSNYSYPWFDNYCESRRWSMPLCPTGTGHQGQDLRPETCDKNTHEVVAVADGTITSIGSYSVFLTADNGVRYDYLHMEPRRLRVTRGQRVTRGTVLGLVSDAFGSSSTTIHLHFNIRMNVGGVGSTYAPVYTSLIAAYEEQLGTRVAPMWSAGYADQTFPLAREDFALAAGTTREGTIELRNIGTATWNPGEVFLVTTEPREGPSLLADPTWLSPSEVVTVDRVVPAGETGRFTFSIRAPSTLGVYPQYFNLRSGTEYFSDRGAPADNVIQIKVTSVASSDCSSSGTAFCDGLTAAHCENGSVVRTACPNGCSDGQCLATRVDADGDGSTSDRDCNDRIAAIHPGAMERCGDAIDQDCDGSDMTCPARLPDGGVQADRSAPVGCSARASTEYGWLLLLLAVLRRRRQAGHRSLLKTRVTATMGW